ncbi:crt [Symbiodinium sp. CCMP2592]|nr:crt [Symbiodinium sp. CCMP2592]
MALSVVWVVILAETMASSFQSIGGEAVEWCRSVTGFCHGQRYILKEADLPGVDSFPENTQDLEAVDWDGDGDLDLLVAHSTSSGSSILTYLENVQGSFLRNGSLTSLPTASMHKTFAATDWDADGDTDLLIYDNGSLLLLDRLDNSSLAEGRLLAQIDEGRWPKKCTVAVGDYDQDGDDDVLISWSGQTSIRYFEHENSGNVTERLGPGNPFEGITFDSTVGILTPADLNSDGALDLVVRLRGYNRPPEKVLFFQRSLDGSFSKHASPFTSRFSPYTLTVVDWDADGHQDVIAVEGDSIQRTSILPDPQYVERSGRLSVFSSVEPINAYEDPSLVDWNGDGLPDLVLPSAFPSRFRYFEQTSSGLMEQSAEWAKHLSGLEPIRFVDVNRDGLMDAVACNGSTLMYWQRMANGSLKNMAGAANPFLRVNQAIEARGVRFDNLEFTDWDGDGEMDFILCTMSGRKKAHFHYFQQAGGVWEEKGSYQLDADDLDYPFRCALELSLKSYISGLAVADWDRDGTPDVLVSWQSPDFVGLQYFQRGFCTRSETCSGTGFCNPAIGTCQCLSGYKLGDCSGCAAGYYSTDARNVHSAGAGLIHTCHACPGFVAGSSDSTCSTRGRCQDDDYARSHSKRRGNGSCFCQAPFFGDSCEFGECAAGAEYSQHDLFTCQLCQAGWYKTDFGNNASCQPCFSNNYAPDPGSASCFNCHNSWLRVKVNKEKTSCTIASVNFLVVPILLFSTLFFLMLPFVAGLPLQVEDCRLCEEGVIVTTRARHWLLDRANRRVQISFENTEHPCLDGKSFQARIFSETQFLLLATMLSTQSAPSKEVALELDIETSMGTSYLRRRDSFTGTGFLVSFSVWQVLLLLCLVGCILLAEFVEMTGSARVTWVDACAMLCGAVVASLVHWRRLTKQQATKLDLCLQNFARRIAQTNPTPRSCQRGASRAISASQLLDFYHSFKDFILRRNMYYLCSNIVRPLTKPLQLSYAEMVGPSTMVWFVSHYWGTAFAHFVDAIRKHAETSLGARVMDLHLVTYWICTFSNNQWQVSSELGESWEFSSFYLALRSTGYKGTVMVLDEAVRPLTRSWCLFELLQTALLSQEKGIPGLFLATDSGVMNFGQCSMDIAVTLSKNMSTLRLQDASASSTKDKEMIDNLVLAQPGCSELDLAQQARSAFRSSRPPEAVLPSGKNESAS